jgi:adenylate cyclase
MTRRHRGFLLVCGLVPTLAAAVLSVLRPAWLAGPERAAYDTLVRWVPTHEPSGRVVIVDVDEPSLEAIGQWPWRRDVIARLIEALRDRGAAVVALDIIFAEPDREADAEPSPDAVLARTLAAGGVVLGYGLRFDEGSGPFRPCVGHPVGLPVVHSPDAGTAEPFFDATSAVCNLPSLTEAADVSGFLNAAPDPDGILRRAPLLARYGESVFPAMALAAVQAASGRQASMLRVANVNAAELVLGGEEVPLDGKSNLLLRYRGVKGTFPFLSAVDVLNGDVGADLEGRIVLVGTTALGTREVVATPLDTLFTGVEVQATIADNLLQGDWLYRPELGRAVETQIAIALGLIGSLVVARLGLLSGAVTMGVFLIGTWAGAAWTLASWGAVISPLYPSIGLTLSLATMTGVGFSVERRRADRAGEETASARRLLIQSLLSLTGIRDAETGRHSERTQKYAKVIAERLAMHSDFRQYLTAERIELLATLAPLHDIGKVGVPDAVLNKPGGLTPEELEEMRRHPRYGREVIERAEKAAGVQDDLTLSIAKDIVYTHHERWDGSGYPEGLGGPDIPIPGRVMALVDVYDAVTTRTLYQPSMPHDDAVAFIRKGAGTHFDPAVVEAFVAVAPTLQGLSAEHAD